MQSSNTIGLRRSGRRIFVVGAIRRGGGFTMISGIRP